MLHESKAATSGTGQAGVRMRRSLQRLRPERPRYIGVEQDAPQGVEERAPAVLNHADL